MASSSSEANATPIVDGLVQTMSNMTVPCYHDPKAPLRGLSPYMIWASEERDNVRAQNPTAQFGQIGKILGDIWTSLPTEVKARYEEKSREDKLRYEREKAEYDAMQSKRLGSRDAADTDFLDHIGSRRVVTRVEAPSGQNATARRGNQDNDRESQPERTIYKVSEYFG